MHRGAPGLYIFPYISHVFLYSSALFPDVVNCMQTDNLELKKLVYLYLMNYAKSQPELVILSVTWGCFVF